MKFWFVGWKISMVKKWYSSFLKNIFLCFHFSQNYLKRIREKMKRKTSKKWYQVRICFSDRPLSDMRTVPFRSTQLETSTSTVRMVNFHKWTRYRCEIAHFHFWPSILDRPLLIVHFERPILAQIDDFFRSIYYLSSLDQLKLNL